MRTRHLCRQEFRTRWRQRRTTRGERYKLLFGQKITSRDMRQQVNSKSPTDARRRVEIARGQLVRVQAAVTVWVGREWGLRSIWYHVQMLGIPKRRAWWVWQHEVIWVAGVASQNWTENNLTCGATFSGRTCCTGRKHRAEAHACTTSNACATHEAEKGRDCRPLAIWWERQGGTKCNAWSETAVRR